MNEVYCDKFEYISCRGNKEVDYEIRGSNQMSTIIQIEENCPIRFMHNVGSGYLSCSFQLLKLCDKERVIHIGSGWFNVPDETDQGVRV